MKNALLVYFTNSATVGVVINILDYVNLCVYNNINNPIVVSNLVLIGIPNIILRRCFGMPCEKIIEVATKEKIDLIVMGTHARTGISHFLVGSVTEKVIRTAPCPVLVIRPNIHGLINKINAAAMAQCHRDFKSYTAHATY